MLKYPNRIATNKTTLIIIILPLEKSGQNCQSRSVEVILFNNQNIAVPQTAFFLDCLPARTYRRKGWSADVAVWHTQTTHRCCWWDTCSDSSAKLLHRSGLTCSSECILTRKYQEKFSKSCLRSSCQYTWSAKQYTVRLFENDTNTEYVNYI